jgi:tripartite-type tricarboxylate transporter receptor subunit TctC
VIKKLSTIVASFIAAQVFVHTPGSAADFYAGKQINLIVGSAPGGGYDTYARLVARHWPDFIPGHPNIVVQNLPAAGSLVAMNTLANSAPRDGLTIGAVQNQIGVEPLLGVTGPVGNARYDSRRMNWLGSTSKEVPVVAVWSNAPFKTFEETFQREMLVGSSGTATADTIDSRLLNNILGTKFKVIEGYKGNPELTLAAETGEIMGRTGWFVSGMMATKGEDIASGRIRVLVQLAAAKHPALPDVPLVTDYISDPTKKDELMFSLSWFEAGRPFVAPPGVPADRVAILRTSFMQMMNSPEMLADAQKMSLDVTPMSGEDVQALMERLYATPKPLIERVRSIMLTT